jgi:hypothetical protein
LFEGRSAIACALRNATMTALSIVAYTFKSREIIVISFANEKYERRKYCYTVYPFSTSMQCYNLESYIGSAHAQQAMKSFPRMLSVR